MPTTRREFIKRTSVGVVGTAALSFKARGFGAGASKIPPHRELHVAGVHAYTDSESVAAGETISFHVSSTVSWRLSICRLGLKMDDPGGDQVLQRFRAAPPRAQPIYPGSYVDVKRGLTGRTERLSIECWIRLWKIGPPAAVVSQFDDQQAAGFALLVNPGRSLAFYAGDGTQWTEHTFAGSTLTYQRWHHLVVTFDSASVTLWIDGKQRDTSPNIPRFISPGGARLRIGAMGKNGIADSFLDADLAMPTLYSSCLSPEEIHSRFEDRGLHPPSGSGVLACWPLSEERGDAVADVSRHKRHGTIINHGTWMIGGPSFDSEVPRFGSYDPTKDETRGHALRLASDDLYDCRWSPTRTYGVPMTARPGLYAGRFEFELDHKPHLYDVTFIVKQAVRRRKAPILMLCATNTWRAYSGTPFAINDPTLKQVWGTNGARNSPGDPPAYNFYRAHAAAQGTFQQGLRMPWPAAAPYILYGGPTDYSHLMRADRFAHLWLEKSGYEFDVIGDLDLHRAPDQLRGYKALIINGHSEYWSIPMYEGLRRYLNGGGNVMCLSGNSLFWRVSYNEDATVLECRKVDAPGEQVPHERRGESWHSHDGLRGGLMRECGYPGWKLVGLETLGWNNQGNPEQFGPYLVDQPGHFLFNRPEKIDVRAGQPIGQAANGGLPRANGHEIDVRLSTLADLQDKPLPEGATMPGDPPGMTRLANGIITWQKGGAAFDYFLRPIKPKTDQGGEMIYWERPEGGRVFNTGSIGTGWALLGDPKLQTLLRNVLHHFGVPPVC
jgi:N,N-dimethylformamidase beta subunit-like protein/concanavalin A-like lectin/glucanase superfamily protein